MTEASRERRPRRRGQRSDRDRLRALTAELAVAEERERRRIAQGLHDNIGQMLGIAKVKLGEAMACEPRDEVAVPLAEGRELVDRAIREIRSLTFELSSPVLHELGLEAALASLAERMEERHGIPCRFRPDSRPVELPEEWSVLAYSIVRELLWNIVKHAGASRSSISIERRERRVRIVVEDDGMGLDPVGRFEVPADGEALGLFGARLRLESLGGGLEVGAARGRGTRIALWLPSPGGRSSR